MQITVILTLWDAFQRNYFLQPPSKARSVQQNSSGAMQVVAVKKDFRLGANPSSGAFSMLTMLLQK